MSIHKFLFMSWFKPHFRQLNVHNSPSRYPVNDAPPAWTPAPEHPHTYGLFNEATDDEYESAEQFCRNHPIETPKLLTSDVVERIAIDGCRLWALESPSKSSRFIGRVEIGGEKSSGLTRVTTEKKCGDVCLMSNLPLLAGLYELQGKSGIYYEVCIRRMNGIIAIGMQSTQSTHVSQAALTNLFFTGTACRPYPNWRFPGWNRGSVGLHLDDMRKFFEDPEGGRDYTPLLQQISPGDTIGCGYDFSASSIFYTYNGLRLPDAFGGVYVPRTQYDVYAAIGVEGACEFEVNFGGDVFRWKEGNEWSWRVEGHVGRLSGTSSACIDDQLPSYNEARRTRFP